MKNLKINKKFKTEILLKGIRQDLVLRMWSTCDPHTSVLRPQGVEWSGGVGRASSWRWGRRNGMENSQRVDQDGNNNWTVKKIK